MQTTREKAEAFLAQILPRSAPGWEDRLADLEALLKEHARDQRKVTFDAVMEATRLRGGRPTDGDFGRSVAKARVP